MLVSKLIYSEGLSSEIVESAYLKDLIHKLRPSYALPTAIQVDKDLEDEVFNSLLESVRPKSPKAGALILYCDKYDEVFI